MGAHALTQEQALRMAQGDSDSRIAALTEAVTAGDAALAPFIEALLADEVKLADGKAWVVKESGVT
ncbi:MAG: urea ABC transporter permease subunit UrtB, partial [Rubrivivax sp.]